MLSKVIKKDRKFILLNPDKELDESTQDRFKNLILKRSRGKPLAYLTGIKSFWKYNFKINYKSHGIAILLSGFFMALHWITYFFSLQWSSVAIGMMALFTYPLITVFLEPLFMNVKLQKRHFILGLMVIFGIYFLVPEFNIENSKTQGLLIGLLSALAYSLRNLILIF